jgi:hypothetical protein
MRHAGSRTMRQHIASARFGRHLQQAGHAPHVSIVMVTALVASLSYVDYAEEYR